MLDISHLSVIRNKNRSLDDVTLTLEAGQMVAVIGENGAGKSTLLHAIAGDLDFTGRIFLHGRELSAWPARRLANVRAVMEQSAPAAQGMSVLELVMLGRYWAREAEKKSQSIAEGWLDKLKLMHLQHNELERLSGGEQQRTHLARCMAQLDGTLPGEQLLLADEPTSALDVHHQHTALHQLKAFAQAGNLVVIVMHDLNLAMSYADKIVLLKQGQLQAFGEPASVCTATKLTHLYEHPMHVSRHPALHVPIVFAEPNRL